MHLVGDMQGMREKIKKKKCELHLGGKSWSAARNNLRTQNWRVSGPIWVRVEVKGCGFGLGLGVGLGLRPRLDPIIRSSS